MEDRAQSTIQETQEALRNHRDLLANNPYLELGSDVEIVDQLLSGLEIVLNKLNMDLKETYSIEQGVSGANAYFQAVAQVEQTKQFVKSVRDDDYGSPDNTRRGLQLIETCLQHLDVLNSQRDYSRELPATQTTPPQATEETTEHLEVKIGHQTERPLSQRQPVAARPFFTHRQLQIIRPEEGQAATDSVPAPELEQSGEEKKIESEQIKRHLFYYRLLTGGLMLALGLTITFFVLPQIPAFNTYPSKGGLYLVAVLFTAGLSWAIADSKSKRRSFALGVIVLIAGLVTTFVVLPQVPWFDTHPSKTGLYLAAILITGALSWAIADSNRKRKAFALGTVVLGVLIQLIQVL
jgi:hypothetical protein